MSKLLWFPFFCTPLCVASSMVIRDAQKKNQRHNKETEEISIFVDGLVDNKDSMAIDNIWITQALNNSQSNR